ncbi:MAG: hypothetical protein HY537_03830 [Deltaproteobacteria bacterium]|nr:hypothetical protein [Deltaproteobacteria bacterium]
MERLGENLRREASYIHDLFVKQQTKVMEIEKRLEARIDELKEAKELKSRNLTEAAIEELLRSSR